MNFDRKDWRDLDRNTARGFRYFWKWVALSLVIIALLIIAWVTLVSPRLGDAEADRRREGHEYVESQRTFMLQKLSAIEELQVEILESDDPQVIAAKEDQIKAFTRELRERVETLDEDEVPQSVRDYLEEVEETP